MIIQRTPYFVSTYYLYKQRLVSKWTRKSPLLTFFLFHLKVEMSSFGRILLKIFFFIENVIKNNICLQKLSFEAFKNHVYKLVHDCYLTL